MSSAWKHPSFGQLEQKGSTFSTTVTVPAFKRFSYDTGYSNARRSTGTVSVSFAPWRMNEELLNPTREMVNLAEKILADPDKLVDAVAHALWEEFNGRGPTTGMWWYGGMDTVNESFLDAGLPLPKQPEDVLPALQLTDIHIFTWLEDYVRPVVVLTFHAAFEQEHGLCVVTDGERVLGSSYACEPQIGKEAGKESE